MKTSLIVLACGLLTAVYAADAKHHTGFYKRTKCGYHCSGNEPPLGCQNVTAENQKKCQPFTFDGCYDDAEMNILKFSDWEGHSGHSKCAQDCFLWKYYAVSDEYCHCGDHIKKGAVKYDPELCKAPCPNNAAENCARPGFALVYRKQSIPAQSRVLF
ncbi:hypothetical protein COCMIDRAFT_95398 [Bipolaris oryzae ATCC 44560]|uniref:WSC domain-containing protein n=1 Tax=Bipolaris oryzae ATCC 44560 TaxID=930090 RepID=W6Z6P8_COCMI|nr:uncharacterized protein COCMIDRAFT_95398 [Bipolaris oryzae ATCC 44560]EUC45498.1 hypothetical protein COCMIDRAFT_95398 [Bipolaris oryzae ATCC 44560]